MTDDSRSALGWGAALLALGAALLLRNTGVIADDVAVWPWAMLAAGIAIAIPATARRGSDLVLPVVLVAVGGVFALRELDLVPLEVSVWPVLLIAAGLALLAGSFSHGGPDPQTSVASMPLDGARSARLELAYGAGTLRVSGPAEPGLAYAGTFAGGVRQGTEIRDGVLHATLRHASNAPQVLGWRRPLDWDLQLGAEVPVDLEIQSGASRVKLDLSQLQVRSLKIETGASDVDIVLPAHGRCRVDIDAAAADINVRVPDGVAAAVRTSSALASINIDPHRFPRTDGVHRSTDFDTAADRAEIDIDGALASIAVR